MEFDDVSLRCVLRCSPCVCPYIFCETLGMMTIGLQLSAFGAELAKPQMLWNDKVRVCLGCGWLVERVGGWVGWLTGLT